MRMRMPDSWVCVTLHCKSNKGHMPFLCMRAGKVSEPATGALYTCIRAAPQPDMNPQTAPGVSAAGARAQQLCAAPHAVPVWGALMSRAAPGLVPNTAQLEAVNSPSQQPGSQAAQDGASEWLQLLVGALCFTHALLPELLACVALVTPDSTPAGSTVGSSTATSSTSTSSTPANSAPGSAGVAWGPYTPPLLYLVAHEAEHMQGSTPEASAAGSGGDVPAVRRPCNGLDVLVRHMVAAAEACSSSGSDGSSSACGGSSGSSGSSSSVQEVGLARHVLEACLQVLRCLAQRDDRGAGLCGGSDPVPAMCDAPHHLHTHLLRMLAALPPPQKPRDAKGTATAAAGATAPASSSTPHAPTPQTPTLAVPEAAGLVQGPLPRAPPYIGYRGDVLSVLANVMFARPAVAERIAQLEGAVELVLSQVCPCFLHLIVCCSVQGCRVLSAAHGYAA